MSDKKESSTFKKDKSVGAEIKELYYDYTASGIILGFVFSAGSILQMALKSGGIDGISIFLWIALSISAGAIIGLIVDKKFPAQSDDGTVLLVIPAMVIVVALIISAISFVIHTIGIFDINVHSYICFFSGPVALIAIIAYCFTSDDRVARTT